MTWQTVGRRPGAGERVVCTVGRTTSPEDRRDGARRAVPWPALVTAAGAALAACVLRPWLAASVRDLVLGVRWVTGQPEP
jgi:hypothetical protein